MSVKSNDIACVVAIAAHKILARLIRGVDAIKRVGKLSLTVCLNSDDIALNDVVDCARAEDLNPIPPVAGNDITGAGDGSANGIVRCLVDQ